MIEQPIVSVAKRYLALYYLPLLQMTGMEQAVQIPEPSQKFSNIQLELLRLYAHNVSDEELLDVKDMLARYFADKAIQNLGEWNKSNHIDDNVLETWLSEKT